MKRVIKKITGHIVNAGTEYVFQNQVPVYQGETNRGALSRRITELESILRRIDRYSYHDENCKAVTNEPCICGLSELLNPNMKTGNGQ